MLIYVYFFIVILILIIFFHILIDTEFKKYDSLTRTWYFGSKEKHHKSLLKKNPNIWKETFYYRYGDTEWYKKIVNRI